MVNMSVEPSMSEKAPSPPRSGIRSVAIVAACTGALIMQSSNSISASIALPDIGRDLNISEATLQWPINAYSLSSACLLLLFGRLADLHGRKKVFTLGYIWLVGFSIGCGFAQNEIGLDVLRALQGIGSAAVLPASVGILAQAFPPSRTRAFAFATFSAGAPVGAALGVVIGSVLTQLSRPAWRSTFYLSAGLSALFFILGLVSIDADRPSEESDPRVDWIGAALVTIGLVLIVFVLGQGEVASKQWGTPYIIALLVIGVLFVTVYIFWQRYLEKMLDNPDARYSRWTPPPLMKPSIWKRANGRFAAVQCIGFLNWMAFLGWSFWAQLYYQEYKLFTPILTMVRLLPMFVTGVTINIVFALIVGRVPLVYLFCIGTFFTGVAGLLFALINPASPYWAFGFPAAILAVFGADFVFATGSIFIAKVVEPNEQSVAGGLYNCMTQLGTALSLTITAIIFDRVVKRQSLIDGTSTNDHSSHAYLSGYRSAQWACFAFGMFGTLLTILFLRGVGIVGHQDVNPESQSESSSIIAGAATKET